jgi:hypothetical protein
VALEGLVSFAQPGVQEMNMRFEDIPPREYLIPRPQEPAAERIERLLADGEIEAAFAAYFSFRNQETLRILLRSFIQTLFPFNPERGLSSFTYPNARIKQAVGSANLGQWQDLLSVLVEQKYAWRFYDDIVEATQQRYDARLQADAEFVHAKLSQAAASSVSSLLEENVSAAVITYASYPAPQARDIFLGYARGSQAKRVMLLEALGEEISRFEAGPEEALFAPYRRNAQELLIAVTAAQPSAPCDNGLEGISQPKSLPLTLAIGLGVSVILWHFLGPWALVYILPWLAQTAYILAGYAGWLSEKEFIQELNDLPPPQHWYHLLESNPGVITAVNPVVRRFHPAFQRALLNGHERFFLHQKIPVIGCLLTSVIDPLSVASAYLGSVIISRLPRSFSEFTRRLSICLFCPVAKPVSKSNASPPVPARRSAETDCFSFRACTPKCRNRLLLLPWLVGGNCLFTRRVSARRRGWWGAFAALQRGVAGGNRSCRGSRILYPGPICPSARHNFNRDSADSPGLYPFRSARRGQK